MNKVRYSILSILGPGLFFIFGNLAHAQSGSPHQELIEKYCVTCHNQTLKTAGLMLDAADINQPEDNPVLWEKVIRKLRMRAMPPVSMPRPNEDGYRQLISYLEAELDESALKKTDPGTLAPYHKLNRAEYTNAVRDLLAIEFNAESMLPDDNAEQGFDNVGSALTVSPILMESYLSVAELVSKQALGQTADGGDSATYKVHDELIQDQRMGENLPFGSRGGIAVNHNFTQDGEYEIQIRLIRNSDGWIRGLLDRKHPLEIRIDNALVKRFTVGGETKGLTGPIHSRIGGVIYRFDDAQMEYEFYGDADLKVRFPASAGNHLVQIYFLKHNHAQEGMHEFYSPRIMAADIRDFKAGDPALSEFSIAGPFNATGPGNTESRKKILSCIPENQLQVTPCAKQVLGNLARLAYRRPVSDEDTGPLLSLFESAYEDNGFEAGIAYAIQGLLVSPGFLFRTEHTPEDSISGETYKVSDIDLASRLSFFLWSSIPDEELLTLAEHGKLSEPDILKKQVRRMLADSRSRSLAENFAAQWLYLRNLRSHRPDNRLYPDFDQELRIALQTETNMFIESLIREDKPMFDLITADYTFVNERLANHYGIKKIYGSHFRKINLDNEKRKGLLGHGSVLTLTSRANRTSPVIRGKWVLDNLLGSPPPPPPPNVPALNEKVSADKPQTLRERMEQHRNNPVCSTCHSQMEPYGFALDNFGPVGNWRESDNGAMIDAKVNLPDGTTFEGPLGVRKVLENRKDIFIHNLTEKLFIYALGRGIRPQDQPLIRKILKDAESSHYTWSSIILGIIDSTPFTMRRS